MRVVVIGCGLAGITTAYFLHRSGAEVVVIDRAPGPARETSHANGSLLTPSLADPWNAPGVFYQLLRSIGRAEAPMLIHLDQLHHLGGWGLRFLWNSRAERFQKSYLHNVRLARFSQQVMAGIRADTGIAFDYAACGILKIFEERQALDEAIKVAHWLKQVGISHAVLSREELKIFEPALAESAARLAGAVHYPDDEVGDARLFCERLGEWLAADGVIFRFSEQVLGFDTVSNRLCALVTPTGLLPADAFVLAAGAFSNRLGKRLKLKIPVVPAKGYSITLPNPEAGPKHPVVDDRLHAVIVPLGDERLRVAGTAEFTGYDLSLPLDRIDNLRRLLKRVYPQIVVDEARLSAWAGLRPMTPDGLPLLGRSKIENLFVNTGHGALGWTLAAASGKVVAELITGSPPGYDIAPFRLDRF